METTTLNEAKNTNVELTNFIKYCLGYINLTRQRNAIALEKYSVEIPTEDFNLLGLLNGDTDESLGELINLPLFYSLDPKEVTADNQPQYLKEKELAQKIDAIHNKYQNDQFTKQIVLNFGYFKIEIPITNGDEEVMEGNKIESGAVTQTDREAPRGLFSFVDENSSKNNSSLEASEYPLFTLQINVEKEQHGKYTIYPADTELQVNLGVLQPILGDDSYYQLVGELGKYETEGGLSLPIDTEGIFTEIWHRVKSLLKLKEVVFDESSFQLNKTRILLSPKVNYFLAEDLRKLSKLSEKELKDSSIASWVNDGEESPDITENESPAEEELYFPFLYDKSQLRVLSLLNHKTAIVQGPPGTGKSETIANLICHLAANGKKVLFVSQRTQALKVVKDKLKKLGVKYLFGYIPNLKSPQITEEDEIDGVAPQLTGLNGYIENIKWNEEYYQQPKTNNSTFSLSSLIKEKKELEKTFNEIIETERKIWHLNQEKEKLTPFDLPIKNITKFKDNFSSDYLRNIEVIRKEIKLLANAKEKYISTNERQELDTFFLELNFNDKDYVEGIQKIIEDNNKYGYDGRSSTRRRINKVLRNIRLGALFSQLPREIMDYMEDTAVNHDFSKMKFKITLQPLIEYCVYRQNNHRLEKLQQELEGKLGDGGITEELLEVLEHTGLLPDLNKTQEVKENVLKLYGITKELAGLGTFDVNETSLKLNINNQEKERIKRIRLYLQNIINKKLLGEWGVHQKVRQVIAQLAKAFGKSRRAFQTFDQLRREPEKFKLLMDLVPVWMMELDDASRIMPLEAGIFDYVIFDEASQCNVAYTLPAMFRARKTLFFGDSEQMRDNTILFKAIKSFEELAKRYKIPNELQIKAAGSTVQSVLDMATQQGFNSVGLRCHYRSPHELIGFSNDKFYKPHGKELLVLNTNYLTYKDSNRIMLVHLVEPDWQEEVSDKTNATEAKSILALFKELRIDEHYKDKSIGILSFFNEQATLIRELFEKEGFSEKENNYKISIVEGIQGDEKDIILYSFVIKTADAKNRYVPLTGEGGDIQGDINRGRVNVAFSRAKLQVHCFTSIPTNEWPEGIWIKKYLEYAEKNGEVSFYSKELKPFDSFFEKEAYSHLRNGLGQSFVIQNQVESCGFKIDFVVNNSRNGKRLAIECDGPTHFRDELDAERDIYTEDDEERQRILEAAGWQFCRVKYSDWIRKDFDKKRFVDDIKTYLV